MKKSFWVIGIVLVFVFSVTMVKATEKPVKEENKLEMPDNIKAIVEKSCFGCHNTGSKNEDAKEDLDFKKLAGLSKIKKISAYKHIGEVVEKNEMPPKKFLEKYPDKKISDEEKELLISWAKKEAEALVKN